MSHDPATIDYVRRHTDANRSKKEILRKLKRAISREIYWVITNPRPVPEWADLRPARKAKNITLQTVADHFGVWPAHISTIERGLRRDDGLTIRYRAGLAAAYPPLRRTRRPGQVRRRLPAGKTNSESSPNTGGPIDKLRALPPGPSAPHRREPRIRRTSRSTSTNAGLAHRRRSGLC